PEANPTTACCSPKPNPRDPVLSRRRSLTAENKNRNLSRDPGLEVAEVWNLRNQQRPQRGTAGVVQLLRQHREPLGTHFHLDPWVRLQVVVPARVSSRPSVGCDDREPVAFLREAPERRHVFSSRPGSDVVDEDKRVARPRPAPLPRVRADLLG